MFGPNGPTKRDLGDKKMLWKLVDGKPHMVLVKPGLTDGSTTEMVEGELQPGDLLITAVDGAPAPSNQRKIGAF
jgi:HlyD family secretion protein